MIAIQRMLIETNLLKAYQYIAYHRYDTFYKGSSIFICKHVPMIKTCSFVQCYYHLTIIPHYDCCRCFVGDDVEMTVEDCIIRDRKNPIHDPRETSRSVSEMKEWTCAKMTNTCANMVETSYNM